MIGRHMQCSMTLSSHWHARCLLTAYVEEGGSKTLALSSHELRKLGHNQLQARLTSKVSKSKTMIDIVKTKKGKSWRRLLVMRVVMIESDSNPRTAAVPPSVAVVDDG